VGLRTYQHPCTSRVAMQLVSSCSCGFVMTEEQCTMVQKLLRVCNDKDVMYRTFSGSQVFIMAQYFSTGIPSAHDFICRQRGYAPEVQRILRFYSGKETIYNRSSWAWYLIIADRSSTARSASRRPPVCQPQLRLIA